MEELEHRQNKNRISNFVQALLTAVARSLYTASRSDKGPLRIALFWIPAVGISVLGLGFWIGVTLLLSRVRMQ
jgi:hypothetical protein